MGLASFYRRLVKGYAGLLRPLTDLLRAHCFEWTPSHQSAFENIKQALTTAPVFTHADRMKRFIVATDPFKHGDGATV